MKLMKAEEIQSTNELLRTMKDDLQKQEEIFNQETAKLESVKLEIIDTKNNLDRLTKEHSATEFSVVEARRKSFYLKDQIEQSEGKLKANERQARIEDLCSEQDGFYQVLEARLENKIEELKELTGSFVSYAKPEAFLQVVRNQIENRSRFDDETILMRQAKGHYENAVRGLCEKQVDGYRLTPKEATRHLYQLDSFLMREEIAGLWQMG